jgi:hypothetical protein
MTPLSNEEMNKFFEIAFHALKAEDAELRKYFINTQKFYAKFHHGIGYVYEPALFYVVFRALLTRSFPLEVHWEYPYPDKRARMDLGFLNPKGDIIGCIEAKGFYKKDWILADIMKMQRRGLPQDARKFAFVVWRQPNFPAVDDITERIETELPVRFEPQWHRHFLTNYWDDRKQERNEIPVCISLLEACE